MPEETNLKVTISNEDRAAGPAITGKQEPPGPGTGPCSHQLAVTHWHTASGTGTPRWEPARIVTPGRNMPVALCSGSGSVHTSVSIIPSDHN